MSPLSASEWDEFLCRHPEAHLLQLSGWGELKADFSWEPIRVAKGDSGAQILFRKLPLGFSIGYIPMGPIGSEWTDIWDEIEKVCREHQSDLP